MYKISNIVFYVILVQQRYDNVLHIQRPANFQLKWCKCQSCKPSWPMLDLMYVFISFKAEKFLSEASDTGRVRNKRKAMLKLLYTSRSFSLFMSLSMSNGQVASWSGNLCRDELISSVKSSASLSWKVCSNFLHQSWSFSFLMVYFMVSFERDGHKGHTVYTLLSPRFLRAVSTKGNRSFF